MDKNKLASRNTSMDIVRIVAVFLVISVHFFLKNGFYSQEVRGTNMYIMCLMRTLFGVCVPLFMILTGYLMSHKELNGKYYLGIKKTLMIYLLASAACMIFRAVYYSTKFTVKSAIFEILEFEGAPYSWYIEMYIGLFLLIPFLNLVYNNLKTKRNKQILVGTLIVLTILPSVFNIYNFESAGWWADPAASDEFTALIPDWWTGMYPVAYYFAGCYLREYGSKLKTRTLLLLFVLSEFIFGSFNFYRSYGATFKTGSYAYWNGFQPFIMSVLLFVMLSRIKNERIPDKVRFVLWKISDLALSMYLVSYIFDSYAYPKLKAAVTDMPSRLIYYFVMVPFVFICSMVLSAGIELLRKAIDSIFVKLCRYIKALKNNRRINKQELLFVILMIAAVIFSAWKCFYGFGGFDESFYITIPHRLSMGDALLFDEWHLSQLSGFLLIPIVWLYRTIVQSMDGIIMFMRFMYVLVHAAVAVFAYLRLKKYGYLSVFATVLYFVFTPYDIMALSYNTMGMDLLVVVGVLMATSDKNKKLPFILSGLFFAAAVLCNPYLAAVYVIYAVIVCLHTVLVKIKRTCRVLCDDMFSMRTFLLFTIGVVILAAVFCIFLLSRAGLSDILESIPAMLTDPEHPQISVIRKLRLYIISIYDCHPYFCAAIISFAVLAAAMIIDRNRRNHRAFYLMCSCLITVFSYIQFLPQLTSRHYNSIMYPMIFVGLTAYILCENKPKRLFVSVFMLGFLYSVCMCFSSNQYFYVIAMATAVTNISSFIFLGVLLKEMKERNDEVAYGKTLRYAGLITAAFTIILLASFQIKAKAEHCFWESGETKTLDTRIEHGPAKGIYTSSKKAMEYEGIYRDMQFYDNVEPDNLLVLSKKTWCYLMLDDFPYGTFSAWLSGENANSLIRLQQFYSINPDKVPIYIYLPKISDYDTMAIIEKAVENGYSYAENNISYKLTRVKE